MPYLDVAGWSARAQPASTKLLGGERWYVVHTQPCCEFRAAMNLYNQKFAIFLPKRYKTIRHARKLRSVEAAFFPGYLFIALDLARQQWRRVNSTFGVNRLVMQGDRPHPVPDGIVEALRATADDRGILRLSEHLRIGSRVRLMAGPFAEHLAILDRLDGGARVRVLLDILGRKVTISTTTSNVLPVGDFEGFG
jgi:transcription elongation factor/antiterminator RfaH